MTPRPLVMIHGFMGGKAQWNLQRDTLGRDRQIITPDLPGFASCAHLEAPETIAGFAGFIWEKLNRHGLGEIDLLGHSMGGMIVQEMVAREPGRVKKLILYATASTGALSDRFESFERSKERLETEGTCASARRIAATWFLQKEQAPEFEKCAAIAESASPQALFAGLAAMKGWSGTDNLPHIGCHTLIIWGERDRTYGWRQIETLWTYIPDASLAVLPACAHAAHLEKPHLFNAILADFLA